jgi:hypothetical protein
MKRIALCVMLLLCLASLFVYDAQAAQRMALAEYFSNTS